MNLKEFANAANGLVPSIEGVELMVEDRATGEFYKIDELAVDTERKNVFIVVNSDREGSGK